VNAIRHAPVRIGAGAWIGVGAFVSKGVTIGEDSIVAAASVVVDDVPPSSLVAGNPARVVRTLEPSAELTST
jgi:acetyltransferase-like isoleucine patch superfamily enzyme